jgi:molybdopterin/thiamine biosynthesis adenylyltransferase
MGKDLSLKLLERGEIPPRYQRNIGTIGLEGQKKLLNARVAIVGAGGLGGFVIESLARYGVGCLKIIDGDEFAAHNLNRQLLATESNLGVNKAIAAAKRVLDINSDVYAVPINKMLTAKNAPELLTGMDVVVDALDSINSRLVLAQAAKKLNLPLVHGAIAGFTGQVTAILPNGTGLEKLYQDASIADKGIELTLGTPATTPALAANFEAQEVIKILTGVGEILAGKLLYFDTELNIFEILQF